MLSYSNKYKDAPVKETINKILSILESNDLEIEQNWCNDNSINTFSVRINIKGMDIGSNGKGVSKDFALASGLAELLERLQNQAFDIPQYKKQSYTFSSDEIYIDSKEIFENPDLVTKTLIENLEIKKYSQFNKIIQGKNKLTCIPFYDVKRRKKVYLPCIFIKSLYGTNGLCAGNTMEEALIQGLSEIFERHVQNHLFKSNFSFPEIKIESIKPNKSLYNRLNILNKRFNIKILNCTIAPYFPTICLLVSNKKDGLVGFKLGCHPNIFIAIERTLTEAAQGQSIETFSKKNSLEFNEDSIIDKANLCNLYDIGYGALPVSILNTKGISTNLFCEECSNNHDMLKKTLNKLSDLNFGVFIRDNSILGFPSYQIIIPDFSEMETFDYEEVEFQNSLSLLEDILKYPSHINNKNIDRVIIGAMKTLKYISFNKTYLIYKRQDKYKYPFFEDGLDLIYFLSICFIYKKDYLNSINMINILLKNNNINGKKRSYLECLKFATNCLIQHNNLDLFKKHASFLFEDNIANYTFRLFQNKNAITYSFPDEVSNHNFSKLKLSRILYNNIQTFSQNDFIEKIEILLK